MMTTVSHGRSCIMMVLIVVVSLTIPVLTSNAFEHETLASVRDFKVGSGAGLPFSRPAPVVKHEPNTLPAPERTHAHSLMLLLMANPFFGVATLSFIAAASVLGMMQAAGGGGRSFQKKQNLSLGVRRNYFSSWS